uniref:Uncharacterized protein n=1 Tax=Oryza meridionalis TaxID=40149 RepID=A0A0E0F0S5_9ORYZ
MEVEVELPTDHSVNLSSSPSSRFVKIEMVTDLGSTSPPGSPSSPGSPSYTQNTTSDVLFSQDTGKMPHFDMNLDAEDMYSLDEEEDPYFNSLLDNSISTAKSNGLAHVVEHEDYEWQSTYFAESALKHYNSNEKTRTITSCGNLDEGFHGHVNFIAKGDCKNLEELFFTEVVTMAPEFIIREVFQVFPLTNNTAISVEMSLSIQKMEHCMRVAMLLRLH